MNENRSNYTPEVVNAIRQAFAFAAERRYEYVTVDNLMLFIADTTKGKEILKSVGVDLSHYKTEVIKYLEDNISKFPKDNLIDKPQYTIGFHKTLEQASILQKAINNGKTEESHIIISLFEQKEDDTFTLNYFEHFSITRFDVMGYIAYKKTKAPLKEKLLEKDTKDSEGKSFLDKYAILLNAKASLGKIDPVIGRSEEINKVVEILAQRRKNNPILVGDPGVGKTAIAEGLVKRIIDGNVPEMFKNYKIYSLDLTAMVAGSRYRGDFEERLKGIIKEASENTDIILFIDEIHTLIGAGTSNGTMDASNIMKPALSSGLIKVIGATTYEEYRKYFEKEGALARRFQKVDINEPSKEDTLEILKGLKNQYEEFHNVKYDLSALVAAVDLSAKYITDRRFPDKAIDALDIAGAHAKLNKKNKIAISDKDISRVIANIVCIPINEVQESDKIKLKNLDNQLKNEIFGQEEAINKVVDSIILSRASLSTKDKPVGSFLFAGPSGVGKTELCKQIAKNLGVPFIRFDMSEYMEMHSVAKLIGAAPGYVGYDQGGQLISAIRKTPHAVLLLDEVEKAHPNILNILLQVMDYGVLTDNSGQKADFKNIILIMTTNAGASQMSKNTIGFTSNKHIAQDRTTEIKKLLSPEFYNRLDSVVQFNALTNEDIGKVIIKQLKNLQTHLSEKRVIMLYTNELISFITKNGFDNKMGARPIERFIETNITQHLAKEILFGKLENGGEIKIDIIDNKIHFDYLHAYKADNIINISTELDSGILNSEILPEEVKPLKKKRASKKVPQGD
jgi:ATP-dependent Clp protease ATP-binding subunit ClpA